MPERRESVAVPLCIIENHTLHVVRFFVLWIKTDATLCADERWLTMTHEGPVLGDLVLHVRTARCHRQSSVVFGTGADKIELKLATHISERYVGIA